jgi:hypothetical protein
MTDAIASLLLLGLTAAAGPVPADAETRTYSGRVVAVDVRTRVVVVEEIGRRGPDGTSVTRHLVRLTGETVVQETRRLLDPNGGEGRYVESLRPDRALRAGEFVTVRGRGAGSRTDALTVTVVALPAAG